MKKRLLSALLTFCLMLTLLPAATSATGAATSVQLGDVTIDSSTPYWRNGEVTASNIAEGYNAYFHGGALTLKDAIIDTPYTDGSNYYGIYAEGNLSLLLEGNNLVSAVTDATAVNSYGVYVAGELTISRAGELIATGGNASGESYGLYASPYITISGGTITANAASTGSVAAAVHGTVFRSLDYYNYGFLLKAGADQSSATLLTNPPFDVYQTYKYVKMEVAPRVSTPVTTFSFDGPNAGKLLGTTAQMEYSLDGDSNWVACSATSTNLSGVIARISATNDIRVKSLGDGVTTSDSLVQIIDITQPDPPTSITPTDCSTLANNNGVISGLTTAMEYKLSTAWTTATGGTVTGLVDGTYLIRVKATGTALASDTASATIGRYSGTPADTPSATFSFDGSDAGKLLGTTAQMKYSLDGGSTWVACTAANTDLSAALDSISATNDIKVRDMGDGVYTIPSLIQVINITQADTPNLSATQPSMFGGNGSIPMIDAHEYRLVSDSAWTAATGATSVPAGSYLVRVKATGTALASDTQTIAITAYVPPADTPSVTFSFDGSDAYKLLGTTARMMYSLDGGSIWVACTATSTDLSGSVSSMDTGDDIKIKDMGDGNTTLESAVQTIDITKADKPGLTATQPSTIGGSGSIPMTAAHEYKLAAGTDWASATGTTSLAAGNYLVRVKATGTTLASDAQSITLTAFTGTLESTPTAAVDYTAEKLTNLAANGSYAVNGADVTTDGEGKLAIDHSWWGTTISLVKKGDGVRTNDSEAQSLNLAARPETPACTVTQPSASIVTGTISGIATDMQYSINNGATWVNGTGGDVTGLAPGRVLIRVAATGTAPASGNQTITIVAYSAPPSDDDDEGGNATPAPVTEINSGDSVTDSNLDRLVSAGKTLTVVGDDGAQLVFDTDALKGIGGQTTSDILVELKEVSPEHQDTHPGKRVFTLTVRTGGKTFSEFGGSVTVTLPYTLKDGETAEDVTVWYLSDDGTMSEIPCTYDPATGLATFQVSHFSRYVVGTPQVEIVPPEVDFSDVREGDWFYGVVRYVADKGLMEATDGTAFSPQSKTTRSMLVTALWRLENKPEAIMTATFADVLPDQDYFDAVSWGAENGLVGGYSALRFGPNDGITREQLAVFLYRYAKYKGADVSARGDLSIFKDKPSAWARESVQWAVAKGLIRGNGSSNFLDATGGATRAQTAAILQRFIETVLK